MAQGQRQLLSCCIVSFAGQAFGFNGEAARKRRDICDRGNIYAWVTCKAGMGMCGPFDKRTDCTKTKNRTVEV